MLSTGLAVIFVPHRPREYQGLDGLIVLSESPELTNEAIQSGLSFYQVCSCDAVSVEQQATVTFTSSTSVHRSFRDAALIDRSLKRCSPVPQTFECLAEIGDTPVWAIDRIGGRESHFVGIDLPHFGSDDFFHVHFRATRWFAMVPLLHFLRQLLGSERWQIPEPRATFIIDDPNLHHRSYGYLDFETLVKHAEANNYHATVATVPLDAWYFNRDVATLFREHSQHISLMMHGVNHIADELARDYSDQDALVLLAAGLRRIAEFESRSGLKVARIMAAPHGAFADFIADPMLRLGYEAGCVSIGSLIHWNPDKPWETDLGLPVAQALGQEAFPVFHRVGTNEVDVRLSAFLGHPIIIATHHQDYVSHFTRIESLAKIVNQISDPRWMTIQDISRTNYVASVDSKVLRIRPYSRLLTIPLSKGLKTLQILASPFCPESTVDLSEISANPRPAADGRTSLQYEISNDVIEIAFPPHNPVDYETVDPMPLGLWPVARRLLAEGRDRAKPILSFAASSGR
jgi:hypothetical protein